MKTKTKIIVKNIIWNYRSFFITFVRLSSMKFVMQDIKTKTKWRRRKRNSNENQIARMRTWSEVEKLLRSHENEGSAENKTTKNFGCFFFPSSTSPSSYIFLFIFSDGFRLWNSLIPGIPAISFHSFLSVFGARRACMCVRLCVCALLRRWMPMPMRRKLVSFLFE